MWSEGFEIVPFKNPKTRPWRPQNAVYFYYNKSGYIPPAGDFGTEWFWTKTIYSQSSCDDEMHDIFDGLNGAIGLDGKYFYSTDLAVRCVLPM